MNLSDLQEAADIKSAICGLAAHLDAHPEDYSARLEQAALLTDLAEVASDRQATARQALDRAALQRLIARWKVAPQRDARGWWGWWPGARPAVIAAAFHSKHASWAFNWSGQPTRVEAEAALMRTLGSRPLDRESYLVIAEERRVRAAWEAERGDPERLSAALLWCAQAPEPELHSSHWWWPAPQLIPRAVAHQLPAVTRGWRSAELCGIRVHFTNYLDAQVALELAAARAGVRPGCRAE